MVHLIDKDKVVEEIESLRKHYIERDDYDNGWNFALDKIISVLNTLEVKEVDLEKEIDELWKTCFNLGWDENSLLPINHKEFVSLAKYFFELGLKTRQS